MAGLGFEIATALALAGAHVLVNGRDAARLGPAVTAIIRRGGKAEPFVLDVCDADAVTQAIIERQHLVDTEASLVTAAMAGRAAATARDLLDVFKGTAESGP